MYGENDCDSFARSVALCLCVDVNVLYVSGENCTIRAYSAQTIVVVNGLIRVVDASQSRLRHSPRAHRKRQICMHDFRWRYVIEIKLTTNMYPLTHTHLCAKRITQTPDIAYRDAEWEREWKGEWWAHHFGRNCRILPAGSRIYYYYYHQRKNLLSKWAHWIRVASRNRKFRTKLNYGWCSIQLIYAPLNFPTNLLIQSNFLPKTTTTSLTFDRVYRVFVSASANSSRSQLPVVGYMVHKSRNVKLCAHTSHHNIVQFLITFP